MASDAPQDVMDPGALRTYIVERKLHPDPAIAAGQERDLRRIIIHNAATVQEVRTLLSDAGVDDGIEYSPQKSTERHTWIPALGDLHLVNSRDDVRLLRDLDQAYALSSILGRNVAIEVKHYPGSARRASQRFRQFAFDLVDEMLAQVPLTPAGTRASLYVLIGPHASVDTSAVEMLAERENDYLNYRILRSDGKRILNLDYIFAGQAMHVLSQMCMSLSADAMDEKAGVTDLRVFHYGKIGLLRQGLDIGDICVPYAALDEQRIAEGDLRLSPIPNDIDGDTRMAGRFGELIGEPAHRVVTVNTTSVLRQRRASLQSALAAGGDALDMEWAVMTGIIHGAKSAYPGLGGISYSLAGIGSDRPLDGRTLGDTPYPAERERLVANAQLALILGDDR